VPLLPPLTCLEVLFAVALMEELFISDGKWRAKIGLRQGREAQMMPVLISTSHQASMLTLKTVKFIEWKAGRRVTRRTMETMHALSSQLELVIEMNGKEEGKRREHTMIQQQMSNLTSTSASSAIAI
jgi:hypothetical protein